MALTIAEVSRRTGLPAPTLRYYEHQFPRALSVERSAGGHRLYRPEQLATLLEIRRLLREEGLSIREARRRLGEEPGPAPANAGTAAPAAASREPAATTAEQGALLATLLLVVERVEELCRRNDRLDDQLATALAAAAPPPLLGQIAAMRRENRALLDLLHDLLARRPAPARNG